MLKSTTELSSQQIIISETKSPYALGAYIDATRRQETRHASTLKTVPSHILDIKSQACMRCDKETTRHGRCPPQIASMLLQRSALEKHTFKLMRCIA